MKIKWVGVNVLSVGGEAKMVKMLGEKSSLPAFPPELGRQTFVGLERVFSWFSTPSPFPPFPNSRKSTFSLLYFLSLLNSIQPNTVQGNGSTICKPNSRPCLTHSFVAIRHQRKYWQGKHISSNCFGARKQTSL